MNAQPASPVKVGPGDALIVEDVQNDFLPGGALPVPRGDEVVTVLNGYIEWFVRKKLPVFATRDWHAPNHCSFKAQGGPWPGHCVASSPGAAFAPGLKLPANVTVISKADKPQSEAYSSFEGTDLEKQLRAAGVRRLFIGGLATEYCVSNTVLDACSRGFKVYLLTDAIRPINVQPDDGKNAEQEMQRRGAVPIRLDAITT